MCKFRQITFDWTSILPVQAFCVAQFVKKIMSSLNGRQLALAKRLISKFQIFRWKKRINCASWNCREKSCRLNCTKQRLRCTYGLLSHEWPNVRSKWLDIRQVHFCVFMDRDGVESRSINTQKKNEANIKSCWPKKSGQARIYWMDFGESFLVGHGWTRLVVPNAQDSSI